MKAVLVLLAFAFSTGAFAKDRSTGVAILRGNTMSEVHAKMNRELEKMRAGNYRNRTTGETCHKVEPYRMGTGEEDLFLDANPDAAPIGWIKYFCYGVDNPFN